MKEQVFYYTDELNDDFAGFERIPLTIDEHYKYQHNFLWKMVSTIVYRVIMTPIAYLYMKIKFRFKVVNKKLLKQCHKEAYFLYGNHTLVPADGYIPSVIAFPKRVMVVVSPENISLKGTKTFMEMIGALPVPNKLSGMRNFADSIHYYVQKKNVITIYPEAHIWPYYTKIRPYKATSFSYPVKEKKPVYALTVTYQKKKRMRITAYIDGPFFPNEDLPLKEAQQVLRDQVYNVMCERSKNSTYEKIKYIKK